MSQNLIIQANQQNQTGSVQKVRPAKSKKDLSLSEREKAFRELMSLKGSLKTSVKVTPAQIREAFEQHLAEEAVK